MRRITPLVEYFTVLNAPKPRPHIPEKKDYEENNIYFASQRKRIAHKALNPFVKSNLFKDLLGGPDALKS